MYVKQVISVDFSWEGNENNKKRYKDSGASMVAFMLANVEPIEYVSEVNITRSNMLFSTMQDDFMINISKIISDEIQKVVDGERVGRGERRGTLGFPALITALCEKQGVFVEPTMKIRSPIDLKFIEFHCTNPED